MKALNLAIVITLLAPPVYSDEQSFAQLRFMSSQAKKVQKKKLKRVESAKNGKWTYNSFLDTGTEINSEIDNSFSRKRRLSKNKKSKQYLMSNNSSTDMSKASSSLNTEVITQEKVIEAQKPSRAWGIGLTSENMKNVTSDNKAGYNGDIFAVQSAAFKYKFQDSLSGQVVQDWYQLYGRGQNSEGEENVSDITVQDLSFRLTKVKVLTTNDITWLVQGRYYAPTSEASQSVGQLGQLRLYFIGETSITPKISASLISSPRYFMQRNKSVAAEDGSESNTNQWRILNSVGFKYSFNDYLALETTGGVYSKKKHNEQMRHYQDFSTSAYVSLDFVSLNFGVRASDEGLDIRENGLEFYNHRVSEYFAIFSISI